MALTDNLDPSKSKAISYDQLNRLVQVAECIPTTQGGTPIPVEDYAYDEEGNRTASHLSALYSSNDHNQLLEDDTYAYDLKGNRTTRTEKATGDVETYSYDSENRLIGYSSPTATATYAFDAIERRIAKTVDGVTTAFIHDYDKPDTMEPSHIVMEFDGTQTLSSRWVFGAGVDEPIGFETYTGTAQPGAGAEKALYADREGSVNSVISSATASVDTKYAYDAYGVQQVASGVSAQRYGYRGREWDAESGLYHQRWRTYDPRNGLFLQMDPLGFGGGQENLYAYVDNDPYNLDDPMGLNAYVDFRSSIDAKKQALGGATRPVSSGVFDLVLDMLEAMNGDWNNFAGSVKTIDSLGPGSAPSGNGNRCVDERGQHLYVIYSRETGKTLKVGIAGNQKLKMDGAFSKRAMDQIPLFGGPTKAAHVVLLKTPGGMMSRAQMLIMENFMVAFLGDIGMGVDTDAHSRPMPGDDLPC